MSAWGGYVFIINLIPLHVFVLLLMQRYSSRVYIGELWHTDTHKHTTHFDFEAVYHPDLSRVALHWVGKLNSQPTTKSNFSSVKSRMVGHPGAVGRSLVLGAVAQAERLFVTVVG